MQANPRRLRDKRIEALGQSDAGKVSRRNGAKKVTLSRLDRGDGESGAVSRHKSKRRG